jgi:serine/threonine protein kinase
MGIQTMYDDEKVDKVAHLFEECLEFSDPAKRSAFLDSACRELEIRSEVEKLLQAHEESGRFLMGGAPSAEMDSVPAFDKSAVGLGPGDRIGSYRLIGLIGEGSTSTVFLAEQEEPVRRWVALKIVKPGMDTRNVIIRFGLERQALALMDHPGIAKLLDAGATPNGRPFFVMELVSGVGITTYCDEHKLTIQQRLELFNQVCNAVFHAHQRGIIHRDLKPENILVSHCDGRAVLKIVDFGIAKVLHSWGLESATRNSLMPFMGTPAYMSPEQIHLTSPDLDTRTDIYSLGALLYEILTGHPPFDPETLITAGLEEMCHIIRNEEPVPPSERLTRLPLYEQVAICEARSTSPAELHRNLTGDLNWITLKSLEKTRDRRYSTAAGFAKDIDRHFKKPSRCCGRSKLALQDREITAPSAQAGYCHWSCWCDVTY